MSAVSSLAPVAVESAREVERLREDRAALENRILGNGGILGRSPAIVKLLRQIEKLAPRDTTVLIQGESGAGKELVARLLHRRSPRAGAPFVAINCAAIADSLLESELFGYEKGAFTGAAALKKGKMELADKGTLFSLRSANWLCRCRPSCFASCRNARWSAPAPRVRPPSISGWWRRRIAIWRERWRKAAFAIPLPGGLRLARQCARTGQCDGARGGDRRSRSGHSRRPAGIRLGRRAAR